MKEERLEVAVVQLDDQLLRVLNGVITEQFLVDADLPELVLDHCYSLSVLLCKDVVQERRLSATSVLVAHPAQRQGWRNRQRNNM
jgi:hypothetical protein